MCVGNPINFLLFIFTFSALYISKVHAEYDINGLSACEQEQIARQIFYPKSGYEMHANALRNQLKQIIENYLIANDGIQYSSDSEDNQPTYDSIDLDALEKHAASILKGKRNVAAMARQQSLGVIREPPKRSLATLAKNGQLPTRDYDDEEYNPYGSTKRNIGSIARSMNGKRNVGSLARDYLLPPSGKRNLPSILRSGGGGSTSSTHGPQPQPKRNVATLARDNQLPFYHQSKNEKRDVTAANNKYLAEKKRSIGSAKNAQSSGTTKVKRDTTYDDFPDEGEIDTQAYQNTPFNYNDLNELYTFYGMPDISNEKRFLGSVVDDGWSSPSSSSTYAYRPPSEKRNIGSLARQGLLRSDVSSYLNQKQYRQQSEKRHLGALARSGWLPAFRSIRGGRFSRSGRARSRTGGFYRQPERHLQPIAGVCERCRQQQSIQTNSISWAAPGLSHWGTPPKLTAIQRSFRGPFHPNDELF